MARRAATQSGNELKRKLERAEGRDAKAAKELKQAERSEPEATEAVEQVAADGPDRRGLAR